MNQERGIRTRVWLAQQWTELTETPQQRAERLYQESIGEVRKAIRVMERDNKKYDRDIQKQKLQAKKDFQEQGIDAARECARNIVFLQTVQNKNVWMCARLNMVLSNIRVARTQFSVTEALQAVSRSMHILNADPNFAGTVANFQRSIEHLSKVNEVQSQMAASLDDMYNIEDEEEEQTVDTVLAGIIDVTPTPAPEIPPVQQDPLLPASDHREVEWSAQEEDEVVVDLQDRLVSLKS